MSPSTVPSVSMLRRARLHAISSRFRNENFDKIWRPQKFSFGIARERTEIRAAGRHAALPRPSEVNHHCTARRDAAAREMHRCAQRQKTPAMGVATPTPQRQRQRRFQRKKGKYILCVSVCEGIFYIFLCNIKIFVMFINLYCLWITVKVCNCRLAPVWDVWAPRERRLVTTRSTQTCDERL